MSFGHVLVRRIVAAGPTERAHAARSVIELYRVLHLPAPEVTWAASPLEGARVAAGWAGGTPAAAPLASATLLITRRVGAVLDEHAASATHRVDPTSVIEVEAGCWTETWSPVYAGIRSALRREVAADSGEVQPPTVSPWFDRELARSIDDCWCLAEGASDLIGVEHPLAGLLIELGAAVTCVWFFGSRVVLVDRPTTFALDDGGRVHHALGAAAQWGDGFGVTLWHGERVPIGGGGDGGGDGGGCGDALPWRELSGDDQRMAIERVGWADVLHECASGPVDEIACEIGGEQLVLSLHELPDAVDLDLDERAGVLMVTESTGVPSGSLVPSSAGSALDAYLMQLSCASADAGSVITQGNLVVRPCAAAASSDRGDDGSGRSDGDDVITGTVALPHTTGGERHFLSGHGIRFEPAEPLSFAIGTVVVPPSGTARLHCAGFGSIALDEGSHHLGRRREWVGEWRTASREPATNRPL